MHRILARVDRSGPVIAVRRQWRHGPHPADHRGAEEQVLRLARLASEACCHGVIASPREVAPLRELLGGDALIVTPGIAMPGESAADHARPATPRTAFADGASHVVVGRTVTRAPDPLSALRRVHAYVPAETPLRGPKAISPVGYASGVPVGHPRSP
ncbi:orotidine 5'-phosphate decarboxylase / HUMPS family protein [Streptomyces sp. NPDC004562]